MTNELLASKFKSEPHSIVEGIPVFFDVNQVDKNMAMVHAKWEEFYNGFDWEGEYAAYQKNNTPFIMRHLEPVKPGDWFMEVGSGGRFWGLNWQKRVCT